jgi:hypothetical protein
MHQRVFGAPPPLWGLAGLGQDKVDPIGAKVKATVLDVIEKRKASGAKRNEKEMDVLDRLLAQDAQGEQTFTTDEITDEVGRNATLFFCGTTDVPSSHPAI